MFNVLTAHQASVLRNRYVEQRHNRHFKRIVLFDCHYCFCHAEMRSTADAVSEIRHKAGIDFSDATILPISCEEAIFGRPMLSP